MLKKWTVFRSRSSDLITQLSLNRGLKNKKEQNLFLFPPPPDFYLSPRERARLGLSLTVLRKIKSRLHQARSRREKIAVWGDFDVDGVCATAVLIKTLSEMNLDVVPYLPDRFSEGYGLSGEGLAYLKREGVSLIITVDSGITENKEVKLAKSLNLEVIITDHHTPPKTLPEAFAILHTTQLAGTGIAWVLAAFLDDESVFNKEEALSLAAVATLADLQPLLGINRSLIKAGLVVINQNLSLGLRCLIRTSALKAGEVTAHQLSWVLIPRLNSSGRLENAQLSLNLLLTEKEEEANRFASDLEQLNRERQTKTVSIFEEAMQGVERDGAGGRVTVVYSATWHEGVLGLVASRLAERYGRPAVVIGRGKNHLKGSGRSVEGFNMVGAVARLGHLLLDHGGHPMAAGFSLEEKRLEEFVAAFKTISAEQLDGTEPFSRVKIESEIKLSDLTWELWEKIKLFEPFGVGNPEPVLGVKGVTVFEARKVGADGRHLKMRVGDEATGVIFPAIFFGAWRNGNGRMPSIGEKIDLAFSLREEVWDDSRYLVLKVVDWRESLG